MEDMMEEAPLNFRIKPGDICRVCRQGFVKANLKSCMTHWELMVASHWGKCFLSTWYKHDLMHCLWGRADAVSADEDVVDLCFLVMIKNVVALHS